MNISTPTIDGGRGADTLGFWLGDVGVRVDLAAGTAGGGDWQDIGLRSIEAVEGTAFTDVLLGGAGPDTLHGNDGPDRIRGRAGRDTADGGLGRDTCVAEVRVSC